MVRAGVGKITVIDHDAVDITNLHRQFLYDEEDVEKKMKKAEAAVIRLKKANSNVEIIGVSERFTGDNAGEILAGCDLVLDGADNMLTRYIINDWCVKNRIPWIYGGVFEVMGMTIPIIPGEGPCLQCIFPPKDLETKTPGAILSAAPIMIAAVQAIEAIKLLIKSPDSVKELQIIDLWSGEFRKQEILKNPECRCCGKYEFSFLAV